MVTIFLPPLMTKADVARLLEMAVNTLDRQDVDHIDGFLEALCAFRQRRSGPFVSVANELVSDFMLALTNQVEAVDEISAIQVVSARISCH